MYHDGRYNDCNFFFISDVVKTISALSNDHVWAEGLLIFYEVFKYLENAMDRLNHTMIGDLDIPGIRRLEAFEKV